MCIMRELRDRKLKQNEMEKKSADIRKQINRKQHHYRTNNMLETARKGIKTTENNCSSSGKA